MVDRQRRAVLALFFVNGATFSSWLPRIPEVRDRLGLSLASLGLVLLGVGLGGLVSSAVGGVLVDRVGSRRAAVVSSVVVAVGIPVIGVAPSGLLLALTLVVLSVVDAVADIAMNVQAADVQRNRDQSVVQRFHAAWSIGTLAGAGSGTAAAAIGLALTAQLAIVGVVLAGVVLVARSSLSADVAPPLPPDTDARRAPVLVLLAALAVALAVVEGTPGDWAAVFVADVHDADDASAALGYVAVSVGMVVGRLAGDRATDVFGSRRLFGVALGSMAFGVAVVATSPAAGIAVVGFAVCGLGSSVLFPALYLQAATTPGVPSGLGLGVMSTGARIGFLASPVLVGTLSEATSLRVGLGAVIGAGVVVAVVLGRCLAVVSSSGAVSTLSPGATRSTP